MSNEVKIGILTIVALILFIWGFSYLGGNNLLSSDLLLKAEYGQTMGLDKAAPVYVRGMKVGLVSDIYLNPQNPDRVFVEMEVQKGLNIPKDARAVLTNTGLMSGMAISLEFDNYCSGEGCAQSGTLLDSGRREMLENMLGSDPGKLTGQVPSVLLETLDSLNERISDPGNDALLAKTLRDVQQTTENLSRITRRLDGLVANSAGKMDDILGDMASLTGNLQRNNAKINEVLSNTASLTGNLAATDVDGTLQKVDGTLSNVDGTLVRADSALNQVQMSLATASQALEDVNQLVNKMNDGEGTLGYLLTSDELAKDLETTLQQVGELSESLKEKPYEYVPFKSRRRVKRYRRQDAEEAARN